MTAAPLSSGAVKSAERALAVLEVLTERESPASFGYIVNRLGYPRSSLHQLLRTLIDRGWVEIEPVSGHYMLGVRTWQAGHAYQRAVDLATRARPYMERVRDAVDETVQLAVLDGRYNVYIAKVDGAQNLIMASAVGRRIESHATGLGKVLLAGLSDEAIAELYDGVQLERFTDTTITDLPALLDAVRQARQDGYGFDHEEHTIGVRCSAVPIRDASGATVAAMSVSVPTARWSAERDEQIIDCLRGESDALSAALGWGGAALAS